MVTLPDILAYLYPQAVSTVDYLVIDDGQGPYIGKWSASLGTMPTQGQIDAARPSAQAVADQAAADRAAILQERQAAKAAIADLQVIIDNIDGATLAQAKGAIKQLAQILKGVIKAVVG